MTFPRALRSTDPKPGSALEAELALQLRHAGLSGFMCQYAALCESADPVRAKRRYRWDFAFPLERLLVEVDGGTWIRGAHARGSGIERDTEKQNLATLEGWRTMRVTGKQVRDGLALLWVEEALGRKRVA